MVEDVMAQAFFRYFEGVFFTALCASRARLDLDSYIELDNQGGSIRVVSRSC